MESLNTGVTPARTVRIPDPLWSRLTEWARESGVGDAEALRKLLELGLDGTPPCTPLKPLSSWMRKAKIAMPGEWLFCAVSKGREWWELDNVLGEMPGAKCLGSAPSTFTWWLIPAHEMDAVREVFAGMPSRLKMHGPRKVL